MEWTLPIEVLQIIFEYLSRSEDLLNCCLVCHSWNAVGLKSLWKAPNLFRMSCVNELGASQPLFQIPPMIVYPLVQIIEAVNCPPENLDLIFEWILQLSNLRVLKFPPGYLSCSRVSIGFFTYHNLRVLEQISVEQTDFGISFLYQLIDKCPLLEDLSIKLEKSTCFGNITSRSEFVYIPEAKHLYRLRIMEEFRLKPCGGVKEEFLEMILWAMPSIQEFLFTTYTIPNDLAAKLSRLCPNITYLKIRNMHVYGNSALDRKIMDTTEEIAFYFRSRLTKLEMDFRRMSLTSLTLMLPNSLYEHPWTRLKSLKLSGVQISHRQMIALASSLPRTTESIELSLPSFETTLTQSMRGALNLNSWQSLFIQCGSSLRSLAIHSDYLPNGFTNILGRYCSKLKHLTIESPTIDEYSVYEIARSLGNSLSTLHIHSVNLRERTLHIVTKKCTKLVELSLNRTSELSHEHMSYFHRNQTRLYIETTTTSRFLRKLTKLSLVNWRLDKGFFDMLNRLRTPNLTQVHISEPRPPVDDLSLFNTLKTKFSEFIIVD